MKKWILTALVLPAALALFAQDETIIKDKNAVTRDLHGFHGVKVAGSIDLYISQGSQDVVAISAPSQDLNEEIITEIEDGILYIHPKKNSNWWSREWNSLGKKIRAYVSAKEIDYINSSGSGNIYGSGEIRSKQLKLIISGSGNIDGAVHAEDLVIQQSGSSNIRLRGVAQNSNFDMSGSGNIYSYDLVAEYSDINITGSGNVEITANKEVNAHISGSGNIRLKGNAGIRNASTSGSGRIKRV